jgi:hypothetical protein
MKETIEESKSRCIRSLNAIREVLDSDVIDVDIEQQKNKLIKLTQLTGLAAECKALAKKVLLKKELEVLNMFNKDDKIAPSILTKRIEAECSEEGAMLVYADRINASVSNSIEGLRSVLSLYKTELENSLKG